SGNALCYFVFLILSMTKGIRRFYRSMAWRRLLPAALLAFTLSDRAQAHPSYREGHILIAPRAGGEAELSKVHRSKGHKIRQRFESAGGIEVLELKPGEDPVVKAHEYAASGLVEFAEPDYRIHASDVPDDPGYVNCWGLHNTGQLSGKSGGDIGAESAWSSQNNAEGVIVAVIDSGVRYTHEDLAANMWRNPKELPNGKDDDGNGIIDDIYGFNPYAGSGDPMDDCGHGTHVAGTIGAVGNNGKGVAGICWKVKIMALKFMDSEGWGDTSDAIACINYARKNGAKVINASWGSSENSFALRNAITSARNAGIIFVVAAGNELANNDSVPSYPANYNLNNVVSVAAVNSKDVLDPEYSNWGKTTVDLAAPGSGIYSTSYGSDSSYEYMSGTSMAAPHVTGAIALLRAAYPTESYTAIISRLLSGVDKLPSLDGKCVSGGRLNISNLFPAKSVAPAPVISSLDLGVSGALRINLSNAVAGAAVETSTDLRNWSIVPSVLVGANALEITTPTAACRFFRILKP
ncbi:MAG TPA: S8 family peptidase, partial [Verrucomicrobiae bacterium]|nr:S8 family peptidase [Verrucomicrobiae bacterium]